MAWSTVSLCTVSDIEKRAGHLKGLIQVSNAEQVAEESIANVKTDIGNHLKTHIQDIYSRSNVANIPYSKWLISRGYSYDDTDSILDDINNPTELNQAAVFLSIADLLSRSITQFTATQKVDAGVLVNERDHYAKRGLTELKDAIHRLKIDFSGDGEITDDERVRTKSFFVRG